MEKQRRCSQSPHGWTRVNGSGRHSLVSAAVCAVAANQEVVAGVDEHPVFRNTFFTLEKGEDLISPVALAIQGLLKGHFDHNNHARLTL